MRCAGLRVAIDELTEAPPSSRSVSSGFARGPRRRRVGRWVSPTPASRIVDVIRASPVPFQRRRLRRPATDRTVIRGTVQSAPTHSAHDSRHSDRTRRPTLAEVVGRLAEWTALVDAARRTIQGRGAVAVVTGAVGNRQDAPPRVPRRRGQQPRRRGRRGAFRPGLASLHAGADRLDVDGFVTD